MFGNSFSDLAVDEASKTIADFDRDSDEQMILFPVEGVPSASEVQINKDTFLKYKKKQSLSLKHYSFKLGVMHSILRHYFDGKEKHFMKYAKEAIFKTYNHGFMANFGKSVLKTYKRKDVRNNIFWEKGENWGKDYINRYLSGNLYSNEDDTYKNFQGDEIEDNQRERAIKKLRELAELKKEGILSEQEYQEKSKDLKKLV